MLRRSFVSLAVAPLLAMFATRKAGISGVTFRGTSEEWRAFIVRHRIVRNCRVEILGNGPVYSSSWTDVAGCSVTGCDVTRG